MINPFSPGGSLDLVARSLAKTMSAEWDSGRRREPSRAGGNIGIEAVAKAPPTATRCSQSRAAHDQPGAPQEVRTDAVKDFEPIRRRRRTCFPRRASVDAGALGEGTDRARESAPGPAQLCIGRYYRQRQHLAGELFKFMTGTKMIHIPYKGSVRRYRSRRVATSRSCSGAPRSCRTCRRRSCTCSRYRCGSARRS